MEIEKPLPAQAQPGLRTGIEDHLCQFCVWLHLFPSHPGRDQKCGLLGNFFCGMSKAGYDWSA